MPENNSSTIDKLITALYLAQSDNREKMLSELIQSVLYVVNVPSKQDQIIKYIHENYHLEPIAFEINSSLNNLVDSKNLLFHSPYYSLSEDSKQRILKNILRTHEESNKRFILFEKIVIEIYQENITSEQLKTLWNVFNEYLLECFMQFGRKAIEIFLPYESMSISEDENIYKYACETLGDETLIKLFKKLTFEYPKRLSSLELRYLSTLANRAERFYSLGIEKEDYDKINSLKIQDLVVVLDTNILYSVLNLRYHSEEAAVNELIKLSSTKIIDLRLVYIRKTYMELQRAKQYLETTISMENFRPNHIKALLASNKLDSFAKQFYENKLNNSETPHPGNKITFASDLLKSKMVNLYNHPFPKLDSSPSELLNARVKEYYDFQNKFNLHKSPVKIEHDVYLREAIAELKERYSNDSELKFVCITLDNSLIRFDQYMFRNVLKKRSVVSPNFILPSVFLKRIRPFIPIITDNYRKAFLTSVTSPSYEHENNDQNVLIQKSMSFFKNLGIEDDEIIINCIKQDLFLEEFSNIEGREEAEKFILSTIGKQINELQNEKTILVNSISEKLKEKEIQIENIKFKSEANIKEEKKVITNLQGVLSNKDETIDILNKRLENLETYQKLQEEKFEKEEKERIFNESILNWEIEKSKFKNDKWSGAIPHFRKDAFYMFGSVIIMIIPILLATLITIFKEPLFSFALKKGITLNILYIYGALAIAQLIELFARTYIINKDRVKNGWKWSLAYFSKRKYDIVLEEENIKNEEEFISMKPTPVRNE